MKKDQKYYELKSAVEKTCIDAINKQKKRESTVGYGLDDYTEGRIVGSAVLARKILKLVRDF
jgi:hypothetical protein